MRMCQTICLLSLNGCIRIIFIIPFCFCFSTDSLLRINEKPYPLSGCCPVLCSSAAFSRNQRMHNETLQICYRGPQEKEESILKQISLPEYLNIIDICNRALPCVVRIAHYRYTRNGRRVFTKGCMIIFDNVNLLLYPFACMFFP